MIAKKRRPGLNGLPVLLRHQSRNSAPGNLKPQFQQFSMDGSALAYSTYLGGIGSERAVAIAVDQAGNAYVTGNNLNGAFPQKDAMQTNDNPDSFTAFVTKFAPDGSSLIYSTYLGGIGNDLGLGIAVDFLGSVYVSGVSQSPDFPTTV